MNNLYNNPLMGQPQPTMPNYMNFGNAMGMAPKYDINVVRGEAGANNFRMAPNSKTLLVDETAPIIWYAKTDSGGYLTVEAYDIVPHKTAPQVDVNSLEERVRKLEEAYVQQSNSTKPRKRQQPAESTNGPAETNGANV